MTIANYIDVDEKGVARISGSRIKVAQLIQDHKQWGWGAEEIQAQLPHLSLAQIHAAFVYYYEHQAEIDAEIERTEREVENLQASMKSEQPTLQQLRARQQR